MNNQDRRAGLWLTLLCLGLACALLILAGLAGPLQTASADLPPRPTPVTPTSTPSPKPQEPAGAWIELHVHLATSVPSLNWQQLWTTVQWQDLQGKWHAVEGWRGMLDEVGSGVGKKTWWVAQKDLSTGPFRWVIHRGQGGEFLAESESFTLPDAVGALLTMEVLPAP